MREDEDALALLIIIAPGGDMSHCYDVSVEVDGEERTLCTLVPGNESLVDEVRQAERSGGKPRRPTGEEIDRAINHYLGQESHKKESHPVKRDRELNEMFEEQSGRAQ